MELPEPHPGPGEVCIRVHSATVNPTDTLPRSGYLAAMLARQLPTHVPGMDAAGAIDELGPATDGRLKVGGATVRSPLDAGFAAMQIVGHAGLSLSIG